MALKQAYEDLYREAKDLEHRMRDSTDHPGSPDGRQLDEQIRALQSDVQTSRSPRDLENRVKQVQAVLDRARHTPNGFMSVSDADRYFRIFEQIKLNLRRFPDYS